MNVNTHSQRRNHSMISILTHRLVAKPEIEIKIKTGNDITVIDERSLKTIVRFLFTIQGFFRFEEFTRMHPDQTFRSDKIF